jgi:endo-1,4-beta-xylanase
MNKHQLRYILLLLWCFSSASLLAQETNSSKGLKDYYKSYFPIGVAVSLKDLKDSATVALITKQFNSLTPENAMKMAPIHPQEDRFNWGPADSIVAFAQAHHMRIRGHNLCWHSQVPHWMFYDKDGKLVTKEVLLQRLKDHIYAVVGRYKGKIYAWDVVNEAISDDTSQFLRNSMWYKICGEDFIFKAFQYAHEADPNAVLFYNDYNTERPEKRERIYKLLKELVDAKIPINGVGLQAHWSLEEPKPEELEKTIKEFSSLGLKVQITELDISVYHWEKNSRMLKPGEDTTYSGEREQLQAAQFARVFDIFRKYKTDITGVTFWNVSDRDSWLNNYPVFGRKNYPLLFDRNLKPKKAYWDVVNF